MDDLGLTRTGIYGEFIGRVRSRYSELGTATNICLWGSDTIATEPSVARDILTDMLASSGVEIFLGTSIISAIMDGVRIVGLEAAEREGENTVFEADVFVDATEHGDLLPLVRARYRVGSSISPHVDPETNVQDITYVAVVKKYPGGLPEELKMPCPPPGYERYAERFRSVVTSSGDRWPGKYPFDIPSHNAYRALPDPDNDRLIVGDDPDTWEFITKTCVNWANDFPGARGNRPGLSVRYIEDPEYRRMMERAAMNKTLSFIWYMQSELGMADWSVDDAQGYGGYFSNDWETARDPLLPPEFAPILRHFPPFPYVREGRRVVGIETLTQSDISRDVRRGRAWKNYPTGLALGEYPVDVHGSHLDRYMERDLGESSESFPRTWEGRQGVFQVPFGTFIPETVDGLLAVEKNISVSRLVNGAVRLQPIAMHTGQAAGAIATVAVREGRAAPRYVNVLSVQLELMESGCWIALDASADVERDGPYWSAVQLASLREMLPKISRRQFGVTLPIRTGELARAFEAALPGERIDMPGFGEDGYISKREFFSALGASLGWRPDELLTLSGICASDLDLSLTRGDAALALSRCLSMRRETLEGTSQGLP
jgi:hypothetical protein